MTTILKLGGELLEDAAAMDVAAAGIATLRAHGPVVVVHGGGRAIDADLTSRGLAPVFVEGLRVTDAPTLDTVVAVLAGRINTALVARLTSSGLNAVGLTGADAALGLSSIAPPFVTSTGARANLGLVGQPHPGAPARIVTDLIALDYVPVIASVGMTANGALLNINADVFAAHLAVSIRAARLVVAGKTPGVFDGNGQTCAALDEASVQAMIAAGSARDGMIAKLTACLTALNAGVDDIRIIDGRRGAYLDAPGTLLQTASIPSR